MKIITFTTDFGLEGPYVASMKGVLLAGFPEGNLVDISHHIPPQDILSGQLVLSDAYAYFPKGSIHVAVVDPGVGSDRKPLIVEAFGHIFVGPDNGIFSFLIADPDAKFWMIDADRIAPNRSATFEGRDLFAPVAARLAKSEKISGLARTISSIIDLPIPAPTWKKNQLIGEVISIDRFGNLISNIQWAQFENAKGTVHLGKKKIGSLSKTYSEGKPNKPVALWNSSGRLEIAVRDGYAADVLKSKKGAAVILTKERS